MEKILVVDDNKYIRFALSTLLEESGYKPITAETGQKGIEEIKAKKPALVVMDRKLPDCDGVDLLNEVKKIAPDIPVIILTAYADYKTEEQAIKLGAYAFISKPFDNDTIIELIKKALK